MAENFDVRVVVGYSFWIRLCPERLRRRTAKQKEAERRNVFPRPCGVSRLNRMNVQALCQDIEHLKAEAYSSIGYSDFTHLLKIERWGRALSIIGYATAWLIPNPITAVCLSLGTFTRWLLAHHIMHRGYDRVPGIPHRYTSQGFARGWRRYVDWFDWLHPDAWDYEHNILHHYHTGEDHDPDLAVRHTEFLRKLPIPIALKYIVLMLASVTWKFLYYAPNTMSVLEPTGFNRVKKEHILYISVRNIFQFQNKHVRRLWLECYVPYGLFHFAVVPLLFFPLGKTAVVYVLINKLVAEMITNLHAFVVIGPNHTADDLVKFNFHYNDKAEFYVTQVLGSVNYSCGTEIIDYLSIWLNYQIEHHLIPDLPMSQYRKIQPRVKALCEKHNLLYRQENVFRRFARMASVCVGRNEMHEVNSLEEAIAHSHEMLHFQSSAQNALGRDLYLAAGEKI